MVFLASEEAIITDGYTIGLDKKAIIYWLNRQNQFIFI